MDNLHAGWLETLMRKQLADRSIARILAVECKKALGPGENYMSDVMRLNMTVVLGSGRVTKRPIIVKRKNEVTADVVNRYGFFSFEIKMYSEILPRMEELMDEFGDTSDCMWAEYYGATEDQLVFEDLQRKGFKLVDRHSGQDLEHALLTLKNMGKYHAMSSVLLRRGTISANQFPVCTLAINDKIVCKFYTGGIQTLADTIEQTWDKKWHTTAAKLREVGQTLGPKLQELYNIPGDKFQIVNHGDCWINNMLFKYERGSNHPIGFRFVDFQLSHYNSYGWDLLYFCYSSIKPEVWTNHREELISAYHRSLISTLEFYESVPDNAPTLDEIKEEMDRLLVVALMVSCTLLPILMADPADAMDMDGMLDDSVQVMHNKNMYLNEKYTEYIKQDLEYFMSKGLL